MHLHAAWLAAEGGWLTPGPARPHPTPAARACPTAGINIAPLLASVGGLGLAVGLATQSVAANVVAAVSLYSGGPFSIGDQVELWSAGALIAAGTVTAVEPLATTLRSTDGNPSECGGLRAVGAGPARRRAAPQRRAASGQRPSRLRSRRPAAWFVCPPPAVYMSNAEVAACQVRNLTRRV